MKKKELEKNIFDFDSNLRLSKRQQEDAKRKQHNVTRKLCKHFYGNSEAKNKVLIFGSYATKTNIAPMYDDQDVDFLFKIPYETFLKYNNYRSNGQSALLEEIRKELAKSFPDSKICANEKIVKITFCDNTHNIEVLPGYEISNKFKIPNTVNGGSWEEFNPRQQLESFRKSNLATDGLTASLSRIIKCWIKTTETLTYSSYKVIENVISYLDNKNYKNKDMIDNIIDCIEYMEFDKKSISHAKTVVSRLKKAKYYYLNNQKDKAYTEFKKVFGDKFTYKKSINCKDDDFNENPNEIINPQKLYNNKNKQEFLSYYQKEIFLNENEQKYLSKNYKGLLYDKTENEITGIININHTYKGIELKGQANIRIDLKKTLYGLLPNVFEVGGLVDRISQKTDSDILDLHCLKNGSKQVSICLMFPSDIFYYFEENFDLKKYLQLIENYFYWVLYFEKYHAKPWEDHPHDFNKAIKGIYLDCWDRRSSIKKMFEHYKKCDLNRAQFRKIMREF